MHESSDDRHIHPHHVRSADPVQQAHREGRSVDWLWLNDGQKQKPVQRFGFILLSIMFLQFGFVMLYCAREGFHDTAGDWVSLIFWGIADSTACLFSLYFGGRGLLNALKFRSKEYP